MILSVGDTAQKTYYYIAFLHNPVYSIILKQRVAITKFYTTWELQFGIKCASLLYLYRSTQ